MQKKILLSIMLILFGATSVFAQETELKGALKGATDLNDFETHLSANVSQAGVKSETDEAADKEEKDYRKIYAKLLGEYGFNECVKPSATIIVVHKDAEKKAVKKNTAYSGYFSTELNKLGITDDLFTLLCQKRPWSLVNQLEKASYKRQQKIIKTAKFIKCCNKNISNSDVLREAAALVLYSEKYGVPLDLAVGVARTESHFYAAAKNKSGACGSMQVLWRAHARHLIKNNIAFSKESVLDPEKGVHAGMTVLSNYFKGSGGNIKLTLARYLGTHSNRYYSKVKNTMNEYNNFN